MNGIINVYKEKGFTSHDVVAKLRGILKQKKIGHTGTLDPEAEGVLPICIGKGTKVCSLLTDKDKVYRAIVRFGVVTDTQDMTGSILQTQEVSFSKEELETEVSTFLGKQKQIPPMYSALKVDGKRLYELAREGKEIERKARDIEVFSIHLISYQPLQMEGVIEVHCSKGTYIRTICHDLGEKLGCGAAMKELIRLKVGNFNIEKAKKLEEIERAEKEGRLDEIIMPVDSVFQNFSKGIILPEAEKYLSNGNVLLYEQVQVESPIVQGDQIRIYTSKGKFAAIYKLLSEELGYKVVKMFL